MSFSSYFTFHTVLTLSIAIRVGLILYSEWHDAHSVVKYTDIDYRVFSDAARFLRTPSAECTYRYTPLLAFLLLPNEWLHPSFGKYLFAACDIVNGLILYHLLRTEVLPGSETALSNVSAPTLYAATHLLNPMVFSISTRGSSEAVLSTLVLLTLCAALKRRWDAAAVLLGVSTHWKIYPFVYGVGCLGVITDEGSRSAGQTPSTRSGALAYCASLANKRTMRFLLISAGTFVALGLGCYAVWGYPFLYESYLYHLHRLDHRHNFSPYFYLVYLSWYDDVARAASHLTPPASRLSSAASHLSSPHLPTTPPHAPILPLAPIRRALRSPLTSFVPQMALALGAGLLFGQRARRLPFAWFVQTAAFVLFNKVCTSQYFLWYLLLLPLILPRLRMRPRRAILTAAVWVLSQALWLWNGFRLEFLGENVFLELWGASLVYVLAHGWVLGQIIDSYGDRVQRRSEKVE
ncbi:glycosyltransferase family 50 protein [Schizophyllum fasciatum]